MPKRVRWTDAMLWEEASKYDSKMDFLTYSNKAVKTAQRRGIYKDITAHMSGRTYWTVDMVREVALQYPTKRAFQIGNNPAYCASNRLGVYDNITAHMVSAGGFDLEAPSILYYILVSGKYYKIGITNNENNGGRHSRYVASEREHIDTLREWGGTGKEVKALETKLLRQYKHLTKVTKQECPILKNGHSELFHIDILTPLDIAMIEETLC